jgi:hypothetical protein
VDSELLLHSLPDDDGTFSEGNGDSDDFGAGKNDDILAMFNAESAAVCSLLFIWLVTARSPILLSANYLQHALQCIEEGSPSTQLTHDLNTFFNNHSELKFICLLAII